MATTIPPTTLKRLAFAKFLFSIGIEQSKASEIQSAASILSFHDSVEFFLQVASEYLNAGGGKEPNFLGYWEILAPKLSNESLPQKVGMRRLNTARNSLKHRGNLPSTLDVEGFRVLTKEFLEEACQNIFGLRFRDISLIDYVNSETVRTDLLSAEALAREQNYEKAAEAVAFAFQKLMDENLGQASNPFFLNPVLLKAKSVHLLHSNLSRSNDGIDLMKFVNGMEAAIDEIRDEFQILATGLDYRKYARFRGSTPRIIRMGDGTYNSQIVKFNGYLEPCEEFIDFAVQFVIDCSIRIAGSKDSTLA
jgi:hypothetical protein